jgi:ribosomal protein L29
MSKLIETLNGMSIDDLKERVNKLKKNETHYRILRQQTEVILMSKQFKEYCKEKGIVV